MPSLGPGRSRGQEGGAVGEAVSSTSFGETVCGVPLGRRLFSTEDADSPRTFSDLVEPLPNEPTASDALLVTRRHARVGLRTARCAVTWPTPCGGDGTSLKPASQRTPKRPAHKGEPHGSPRASSVVSRPCGLVTRRPSDRQPVQLLMCSRTISPSLHPCSASGELGASSGLASLTPTRPCDLPIRSTHDASDRLLPPEPKRRPARRSFSVPRTTFAIRDAHDDPWSSRGMTEGLGVFTTPETASVPHPRTRTSYLLASRQPVTSTGLFDPWRPLGRDL
jgi:hypothetical protein